MNKNLKIIFTLAGFLILFILIGQLIVRYWSPRLWRMDKIGEQTTTGSGFSTAIEEVKKAEEERKAAEEKKKKEEETRQFIATYGPCRTIPILMYHHVDDPPAGGAWLYVKPAVFTAQMDYLVQKGYQSVTLSEVVNSLVTGNPLPPKAVVITFDDGYRDFYNQAFPILCARSLKATVFLITQFMEGAEYLTWEQAREMAGNPLITIGDHTLDHRYLTSLKEEEIRSEVFASKSILETELGRRIDVFAYPYGSSNNSIVKILQEAGFVAAVNAQRGLSCAKLPYNLARIRIGNSSLLNYGL